MVYLPAPVTTERAKPPTWNADRTLVVDPRHDIWRDLVLAVPFWEGGGSPHDIVVWEAPNKGNPNWVPGSRGPSQNIDDASGNVVGFAPRAEWSGSQFTVLVAYRGLVHNGATWQCPVSNENFNGGSGWLMRSVSSSLIFEPVGDSGAGVSTTTVDTANADLTLAFGRYDGSDMILDLFVYMDGHWTHHTDIEANTTVVGHADRSLHFGGRHQNGGDDPNDMFPGQIDLGMFWTRSLGFEEMAWIADDPWRMFRPNWDIFETEAGGTPGTASPAATGLSFSIPQATAASPGSASPDEIAPTVTTPAVGAAGSAVAEPDEIIPSLSIETPTPAGAAVANPDAVSTSFTIPTPTAVEGEDAGTAQPDAISPTLTLPGPTPAGGAVALPDTIAVTVVMPAPSAKGAGTVTPDEIAVAVSMGAVTVEGGAVVTPDTIALTLTLPQATADGQVPAELIAQVINSTFGRQIVTGKQIRQAITGDTFIS